MKRKSFIVLILILSFFITGCSNSREMNDDTKEYSAKVYKIVSSEDKELIRTIPWDKKKQITILTDIANEITNSLDNQEFEQSSYRYQIELPTSDNEGKATVYIMNIGFSKGYVMGNIIDIDRKVTHNVKCKVTEEKFVDSIIDGSL